MTDLRIWRTDKQPDDDSPVDDTWEVVDISGEGDTLTIGTLAHCRSEHPEAVETIG